MNDLLSTQRSPSVIYRALQVLIIPVLLAASAPLYGAIQIKGPADMTIRCSSQLPPLPMNLNDYIAAGGVVETDCAIRVDALTATEEITGQCPQEIIRIFTATNDCGETATYTQTITLVAHDIAPFISCPPNITVQCASDIPAPDTASVSQDQSCEILSISHMRDDTMHTSFCPGVIQRWYRAEDRCGNTDSCMQEILVLDSCDPDNPCNDGTCDDNTPSYDVDLSGSADNAWTSPSVVRSGDCCNGIGDAMNCVRFNVTLADDVVAIEFRISSGNFPSGYTTFDMGCGNPQPMGEIICVDGGGTLELFYCAPGTDPNTYTIFTYSIDSVDDENGDGIPDECQGPCSPINVGFDGCAAIYVGWEPAECTELSADVFNGEAPFTYLWSTFETTPEITVCAGGDEIFFVTVTDANGCTGVGQIQVPVIKVTCANGGVLVCTYNALQDLYITECVDSAEVRDLLDQGALLGPCGAAPCRDDTDVPTIFGTGVVSSGRPDGQGGGGQPRLAGPVATDVKLYPNPVTTDLNIRFNSEQDDQITVFIHDLQGRIVHRDKHATNRGFNELTINTKATI